MKPHTKHYSRLVGEERFCLYLAAISRGDHAEAAALCASCPTHTYSMRDWSFHRREDAYHQVMIALALELAPHLAILQELRWQEACLGEMLEFSRMSGFEAAIQTHWRAVDPEGSWESRIGRGMPMPDVSAVMAGTAGTAFRVTEKLVEIHRARKLDEARVIETTLAGFDSFTRDHWSLAGEEAIIPYAELFSQLDEHLPAKDSTDMDDEAIEAAAATFARLWKSLTPPAQAGNSTG